MRRKNQIHSQGSPPHHFLQKSGAGFTLLEMLVYVFILAISAVIVINSILSLSDSYANFRAARNISTAALTSIERMTREIRSANAVVTANSVFDVHPGSIFLETGETSTTTIEFFLDGNVLKVREGGIEIGPLTRDETEVTNLIFRDVSGVSSEAIRIEMTLVSSVGTTTKSKTFYSTAVIRNSGL